jgi:hypothetical protein
VAAQKLSCATSHAGEIIIYVYEEEDTDIERIYTRLFHSLLKL